MRFDTKVEITQETKVSDGMGGWTVTKQVTATVDAILTPVSAELLLKESGLVSTSSMKVFTRDALPSANFQVQHDGKTFRIIQRISYKGMTMLLAEVDANG